MKTLIILGVVACLLVVVAVMMPFFCFGTTEWLTGSGTIIGLAKSFELLLIIGAFCCIAGIGGIKITSSEKAHMEWGGSVLIFVSALFIGAFGMLRLVSVDEFADYRSLVSPRGSRGVVEAPELSDMNWSTGKLSFNVNGTFQWVCVNVDYFDDDPVPRKSTVFYSVPENGWYVPAFKQARRVSVFYGTGNGPSGEVFSLNKEEIIKREKATGAA